MEVSSVLDISDHFSKLLVIIQNPFLSACPHSNQHKTRPGKFYALYLKLSTKHLATWYDTMNICGGDEQQKILWGNLLISSLVHTKTKNYWWCFNEEQKTFFNVYWSDLTTDGNNRKFLHMKLPVTYEILSYTYILLHDKPLQITLHSYKYLNSKSIKCRKNPSCKLNGRLADFKSVLWVHKPTDRISLLVAKTKKETCL